MLLIFRLQNSKQYFVQKKIINKLLHGKKKPVNVKYYMLNSRFTSDLSEMYSAILI